MPVSNRRSSVPGRFAGEIIDGVRRERSTEIARAVVAVLEDARFAHDGPLDETAAYLALCERAWLAWTRLALTSVTTLAFGQVSLGPFKPSRLRGAGDAARAAARCELHRKLLDLAPENDAYDDWPWRLEAARQIHVSTQKALSVAASIDPHNPPTPNHLHRGISLAADALVTAIAAGFVANGPAEVRATVEAMARRSTCGSGVSAGKAGASQ
jgi:hypothetical protein